MRNTINTAALLLFIWLVLNALHIPEALVEFLLVGRLPGINMSLSPSLMLAIMTTLTGIVVFELLARHIEIVRRVRQHLISLAARRERLPHRRFGKI